ncbi:MAG: EAL domain-containing protein [Thauera sp.]
MDAGHFENWLGRLEAALDEFDLTPDLLEMELTEEVWAEPSVELLERLRRLKALGVALAIDDFGTGYSSLSYLRQLPASVLKIDRSFVEGMFEDENDRVLVESIIQLGHKLGYEVIAEGVETDEQCAQLIELGCGCGQGYLLSPPLPAAQFERAFLLADARR